MTPLVAGYELRSLLYDGPRSTVHRGVRAADGAAVVVKHLTAPSPSHIDLTRYRYSQEITDRLDLDGVSRVLDLLEIDGRPALVCEDIGAISLAEHRKQGLDRDTLIRALADAAESLGRVHTAGIVHRDVNPSNIVLRPDTGRTQLIDFELASRLSRQHVEAAPATRLEGTLAYIAPEQTGRTGRPVDNRSDLYSLGASLFEVLTGEPPFANRDRLGLVHAHLAEAPRDPREIAPDVPPMLAAIALKLLEKEPADRYQSGFGLAHDLRAALDDPSATFVLGTRDLPPWLQFGRKLFGREAEQAQLEQAWARAARGPVELVLVAGYSGVGKSSLVGTVQGAVGKAQGRFAEGKYDQLSNVPFAAWLQALRTLIRDVLTESDAILQEQRRASLEAVQGNGRVLTDLLPDAELLLGPQPAVPELPPAEAQNRFQATVVKFLRSLCSPGRPLVLFLDDLQWADRPSLQLLERVVANPQTEHLLVLGAYRDNEVPEGHPLLVTVSALKEVDAPVVTLPLLPLAEGAAAELVAAAVDLPVEDAADLSAVTFVKTGGNPFFAERFLMTLAEDRALRQEDGRWVWDLAAIEAMGLTENVADLMGRRIARFAPPVQRALAVAAAIGNRFDLELLAAVLDLPLADVAASLWEALQQSAIAPEAGDYRYASLASPELLADHPDAGAVTYRFEHDRVQEAAYRLIPEDDRPELHLSIGRQLQQLRGGGDDALFAVVTQMNRGRAALSDAGGRRELLLLNVEAGQRALVSAAWPAALTFLDAADELSGDDAWTEDYDVRFAISRAHAEAAWMCADSASALADCDDMIGKGRTPEDRVRGRHVKVLVLTMDGRHGDALEVGLQAMEELGFIRPADEAGWGALGAEEGAKLMAALGDAGIPGIADLPDMTDEQVELEADLLVDLGPAAATVPHTYGVIVTRTARLYAEFGLGANAAKAFVSVGLLNAFARNYDAADAFGQAAMALAAEDRFVTNRPAVLMMYGVWIAHWKHPIADVVEITREALDLGSAIGIYDWAGWSGMNLPTQWLAEALELDRAVARTEEVVATARNVLKFPDTVNVVTGGMHAMLHLQGRKDAIAKLDASGLSEEQIHKNLEHYPMMRAPLYTNRLLAAVVLGERDVAAACIEGATPFLLFGGGIIHVVEFTFLATIARLDAAGDDLSGVQEDIDAALPQLTMWAEHSPENHQAQLLIVEAELARRAGQDPLAKFEQAATLAMEQGLHHWEGMALERSARHQLHLGLERAARGYLADARLAYLRWGARAKAQQLEREFPRLLDRRGATGTFGATSVTTTGSTATGSLDAEALLRATTAISTELALDSMLRTVMDTVLQTGGAERGSLLLVRDGDLMLAAQAEPGAGIDLEPAAEPLPYADAIVRYVVRTRKQIVIGDATRDRRFGSVPYVQERSPKSVLCQPVLKQNELIAVLYLENNLATDGFTEARCRMLAVLSSQAAVSLENALLFDEQKQLNEAMARFLPTEFLDRLGRRSIREIELGDAVSKDMTVLFTDVRSFTSISERMTPEGIFAYLNRYLSKAGPVIRRHHGFIDKYIGDAIMALFPTAAEGVAAALDILAELEGHNASLLAEGLPEMRIGIGVHSGPLMLGTIGEPQRMDGTVIADAVNTASRIEGLTKPLAATLIVSGTTLGQLPQRPASRYLGVERLRGRKGTTELYEVYAGDPAAVQARKEATREAFEAAVHALDGGQAEAARRGLTAVLEQDPADETARRLLQRID